MKSRQVGHAFIPGLFRVDAPFNIHGHDFAYAGALGAHAVGVVEGKIGCRSHIGRSYTGIEQPQGSVHIADCAHGGAGVAAQPGLVHDDRGREIVYALHLWLFIFRQPPPYEHRVGLIHLPLAFGGNGIKDNAGFTGAGNSGKHHDFSFWDIQRDIFQIVLPKPSNLDFILVYHETASLSSLLYVLRDNFYRHNLPNAKRTRRTKCGVSFFVFKASAEREESGKNYSAFLLTGTCISDSH